MRDRPGRLTIRRLADGEYSVPGSLAAAASWQHGSGSLVAEMDCCRVGHLRVEAISYTNGRPLTLWITELEVQPDRRREIATALVDALTAWARREEVRAILTRLPPDATLLRTIYLERGFEDHATGTLVLRLGDG